MSKSMSWAARPEARSRGATLALAALVLLTGWRIAWLVVDPSELYVDEAQYWFWGTELAFGAYSKPPLIGWLIRAATELLGQTTFAVRVAAPLLHGLTAALVLLLAQRLLGRGAAVFAALSYASLPAVALGSAMISTDTPLLLCIAAALLLLHELARRGQIWRASPGTAAALGCVIGLGFLSKYAMIYAVAGMCAAAIVHRSWRIRRADLAVAALLALAVLAPNLWWNASHDFVTAHHLAEDSGWQGLRLHPMQALRFLLEQFAVMGPVLFGTWLLALLTPGRDDGPLRGLLAASAVILGIVTLQALTGRALANWGVGFVVPGVIVVAARLDRAPLLRGLSLVLALAVTLALPAVRVLGTDWRLPDGALLLERFQGRAAVSHRAIGFARDHGAPILLAAERDLLADLAWQLRAEDGPQVLAAPAPDGIPRHHWDLVRPWQPQPGVPVALLAKADAPPACANGLAPLHSESWTAGPGFAEGRRFTLSLLPPGCLTSGEEK